MGTDADDLLSITLIFKLHITPMGYNDYFSDNLLNVYKFRVSLSVQGFRLEYFEQIPIATNDNR